VDEPTRDRTVRDAIARSIRERGRIPSSVEVATALRVTPADVTASFRRLKDAHVFVPQPDSDEIYAYNPFCSEPTGFSVSAAGRDWSAICGWDAFGVPAALGTSGTVHARCGDCDDPITVHVGSDGSARSSDPVVFQTCVPARDAWADIRFT
jgi:hypothetical protein